MKTNLIANHSGGGNAMLTWFSFFLTIGASLFSLPTIAAQSTPSPSSQNQAEFNLRVGTSLVLVRVTVHDAHGTPVNHLRKEDFRLFDNGKEQPIGEFELEPPAAETSPSDVPSRLVALFFDDLDAPLSYLTSARAAADQFVKADLRPGDRAALITTSGTHLVDFTLDSTQLHQALSQIAPNEHGQDPLLRSWHNVQMLDQLVRRMALMQGERSLLIVSPGFMSASLHAQIVGIMDRALRSGVVISALNPKGLAPPETADISNLVAETSPPTAIPPQSNRPSGRRPPETPPSADVVDSLDPDILIKPETVLQEFADGTGGEYFHDNNDLKAGFLRLSGVAEPYYLLAFHPSALQPDGKFHALRVKLNTGHNGFTVRARRGYFALPQGNGGETPSAVVAETTANPAVSGSAQEREHINQAVLSKADSQELPVDLRTEISRADENPQLAVFAHLDAKSLHFHRVGDRSQNKVTFVSVIFDQSGKYMTGQQRQASVDLPDEALANLLAHGMDIKIIFPLKPGTYTLREVVTDSEEHHMTAFSKDVKIP